MAMPARQRVLRKVLRENPCSLLRLAKAAGIPHSHLYEARDGKRPASDRLVAAVVSALREWADACNQLADEFEAAE